jgi:hypothetical protein
MFISGGSSMRKAAFVSLVLAASFLLAACGPKQFDVGYQEVIERVPDKRPRWIHSRPADKGDRMYFIGLKTHASSLENGNTDARQNAVQKVVEYLGGTGMVDYTKARVEAGLKDEGEAGNYVEDGYRFLAKSIVNGVREEETYFERVKEKQAERWTYFYNYHVKMSITGTSLRKAAARAFEAQAAAARANQDKKAEAFANKLRLQLTEDATAPPGS